MRPREDIEKEIISFHVDVNAEKDQAILHELQEIQAKSKPSRSGLTWPDVRRIIMTSKITKLTAAAMILVAVFIGMHSPPTLYALQDTIEAYKTIRWIHVSVTNIFPWKEERTTEVWVECDEQGNTTRIRHQVNTGRHQYSRAEEPRKHQIDLTAAVRARNMIHSNHTTNRQHHQSRKIPVELDTDQ